MNYSVVQSAAARRKLTETALGCDGKLLHAVRQLANAAIEMCITLYRYLQQHAQRP